MSKIFILGCPRSGTSMLAGAFAKSGIYMGGALLPPTISNPVGYFESSEINQINNAIVKRIVTWPVLNKLVRSRFDLTTNVDRRAYSFASPRFLRKPSLDAKTQRAIAEYGQREAFCYKDPRFCTTLPTWLRFMDRSSCKFLVVFRQPSKTLASYKKNGVDIYNPPLVFKDAELLRAYARNYSRLLQWSNSNWLFLHYDQILDRSARKSLENFVEMELEWGHLDPRLKRSVGEHSGGHREAGVVYDRLCRRAMYSSF